MKKFLSLLLTLTMVMSLVVLPARADEKVCSANPAEVSLAVGQTGNTQSVTINGATDSATYVWNSADPAIATVSDTGKTATITAVAAGTTSVTCQVSQAAVEAAKDGSSSAIPEINETVEISVTVTDPEQDAANAAFKAAINLTYGNHACGTDSGTIVGYRFTSTDAWNATLKENSGFVMTTENFTPTSNNEITIQGTRTEDSKSVTAKFKVSVTDVGVTVTAKPAKVATNQGTATLTATATAVPNAVITYAWKNGSSTLNGNTATIQLVKPSEQASITCTATYTFTDKSTKEVTSSATTVEVDNTTYEWTGLPTGTLNMSKGDTNTDTLSAIKLVASGTSNEPNDVAYSYVSSNPSAVTVIDNSNGGKAIKAVGSGYATITITAKDTAADGPNYRGVLYTTEVKVSSIALEYSLGSVSNGSPAQPYYQSSLESYAAQLIAQRTNRNGVTIRSMTVKSVDAFGGQFYPSTGALTNGFSYTAPKAALGNAKMVVTAVSNAGSFDITFVIPVTPIGTVFDAQYPQANNTSAWNNNSSYTITPPSGFDRFIVVSKTGTAPTDFSQYNAKPGSTSAIIYDSDFSQVTGKCTLYVIAWNTSYNAAYTSSGKYYSGMLEVSRQNYDIEYTGVAGTTVNFKDNDFTNFLNNVTGANTNKSTSTYYYFSHVTFSSFNNASQGVLYYNNLAMGGSGLSSFNASTKISNLSNVSFAINGKTSSKQIVLNFTLYATEYRSNGLNGSSTKVRDNVPFYGRVVINVVREDVKISVAPGDSLRLSDSAFLNYLNSYSNAYRNASIDYVTFDQSALTNSKNTANLTGALYTYYSNSYSFGSPVKTTDHFYYAPRYNQASLSDVAFYALPYATVGTTVYIPFTIKPQSSNASVSGTLAVTIAQSMNFTDVKQGDYCYDAVKWAIGKDITKGTSATTFSPNSSCTRAQIVTFLWRAAGKPTVSASARCPFTDVYPSMGSDYYNAILWAVSKGITTGTSTTTFSPNATCTRGQIVTFLWRYEGKPLAGTSRNPFTDVKTSMGNDFYSAILWAANRGVASGTTSTAFSPNSTCTRGQAMTFIYRDMGNR